MRLHHVFDAKVQRVLYEHGLLDSVTPQVAQPRQWAGDVELECKPVVDQEHSRNRNWTFGRFPRGRRDLMIEAAFSSLPSSCTLIFRDFHRTTNIDAIVIFLNRLSR